MGKGTKVPAPPPELLEAQIENLGIQNDAVRRMVEMAEEMQPLQREQLQQTIDQQRQLWEWNQEDRAFALDKRDRLSGIQNTIAQDAVAFSESDRRADLAARSDADVAQAFGMQRDAMNRNMARMGVNPNDGRMASAQGAMATQEALARVAGRRAAGDTARTERLQLYDRANNALAGYPSMSMSAQQQGVGTMGAGITAFNSSLGGMMQPTQTVAGMANQAGNSAANMWGTQMNAHLNAQQNRYTGWSQIGGAIGTMVGAGMRAYTGGMGG